MSSDKPKKPSPHLQTFMSERANLIYNLQSYFKDSDCHKVCDLMPEPRISKATPHYELGDYIKTLDEGARKNFLEELVSPYIHDCPCSPELLYYDENENMIWLHNNTH